jgi:hypothetical protein
MLYRLFRRWFEWVGERYDADGSQPLFVFGADRVFARGEISSGDGEHAPAFLSFLGRPGERLCLIRRAGIEGLRCTA